MPSDGSKLGVHKKLPPPPSMGQLACAVSLGFRRPAFFMSENTARNQLKPESFVSILPEILATLRDMNARKLRVVPLADGGFEIEVVEVNKLYVSRRELAEMMPRHSEKSNPLRLVDELVALGLPHVRATGSRIYNVPTVVAWLEKYFGVGGGIPNHAKYRRSAER